MFKRLVVAALMILPISTFTHGHGGHDGMGGMGGHNFGGHDHAGNTGHTFSGHSFGGRFAEHMNAGGEFTGFSKSSVNIGDYPITNNTTRPVNVKDGVTTKNITYNGADEQYSAATTISKDGVMCTSTVNRDRVVKEVPTVVSADMCSHNVAITNGTKTTVSTHSYDKGAGGPNVHACNDGVSTYGSVHTYNDVVSAAYSIHVIHNDELTRIGYNVVSLTQCSHIVVVRDGDYTHIYTAGYIGNGDAGFGWNGGITRGGQHGFEHSVNGLGVAAIGNFGPTYYGEKAANLKTGEVETTTNYQPAPQPTLVVTHVTPAVVIHVAPVSIVIPVTPSSDITPTTTMHYGGHGDSVTLHWST